MKHFFFILCVVSSMAFLYLLFGEYLRYFDGDSLVLVVATLGFSIITGFLLWKYNYFTRNKS